MWKILRLSVSSLSLLRSSFRDQHFIDKITLETKFLDSCEFCYVRACISFVRRAHPPESPVLRTRYAALVWKVAVLIRSLVILIGQNDWLLLTLISLSARDKAGT